MLHLSLGDLVPLIIAVSGVFIAIYISLRYLLRKMGNVLAADPGDHPSPSRSSSKGND